MSRRIRLGFVLMLWAPGSAVAAAIEAAQETQGTQKDERSVDDASEGAPHTSSEPPSFEEHVLVEGSAGAVPVASTSWTKMPLELHRTPVSVSVVPGFVLEGQEADVLGDALKNVSGVNVATGFGVFDFFTLRGFSSLDTGLVLTDGAFEPESTFYQLYNVDRVEVLKGPIAFLYGANPLSGAVNLVRKRPMTGEYVDVGFGFGHFSTYDAHADLNLSSQSGGVAFRLNALVRGSEEYRDDKQNELVAANPALTLRVNEKSALTFNFEFVDNRYKPDTGLPLLNNQLPDVPRTRSYQWPSDVSDQEIYRLRVDLESEINEHLTMRNKLYYTDFDWQSDGTLVGGAFPTPDGGAAVFRNLLLLDDRQKVLGNQLEAALTFSTGGIRHVALAGFEASRLSDEFTLDVGILPPMDLFDPVETASEQIQLAPGQSTAADARSLLLAPYFVDRLELSSQVDVFIGGRWDVLDYEDEVTLTFREATDFNPMAGIVVAPREDVSLYASYGEAFAPPSSRVVGDREPEQSRQIEVGVKKRFGEGRGKASLAFYHLERDNIAIPDSNGFTQQTGQQRSRGMEVELSFEAADNWFWFVGYALNDSELTEFRELRFTGTELAFVTVDHSGNTAPFAPRQLFNLWTTRQLGEAMSVGVGARYVSGQFIAPNNAFEIDDYLTFDANVEFRSGNWKLSLNVKNLTDRDFETRGFGDAAVIPADPITVFGAVRYRFGR